jgi:GNAT superfamily N-acetyltransferase
MLIRPVQDQDVAAMAAIRTRRWESATFWQSRIARYLRGEHSPQPALPPRAAFVAVEDGAVVGFVSGHRTRRYGCDGELQWIDVIEDFRRRGIAGDLLLTIAGWFVEQSALRICVNVDPKNLVARRLYSKYGAQPLNEHWMVWEDVRAIRSQEGN